MSEPNKVLNLGDGKFVTIVEQRLRCKQGHEMRDGDAFHLKITGTPHIAAVDACPVCVAAYLREHFGMEPVPSENTHSATETADEKPRQP